MKHILLLGILYATAGLLPGRAARGETRLPDDGIDRSAVIELQPLVITPRRGPIGLSRTTETITLITSEEIDIRPARNLGETLTYSPGIDIAPRQRFGRATSISLQGSDSRHVRVMIDGIPLNNNVSQEVDPSRLPIENVDRIEIIKGAASSMWGSSLGGVINVLTKDTGTTAVPGGSLTASWAESRTHKESLDLNGAVGDIGYYLFSSYTESGGRGPRDDTLSKKSFAKLSHEPDDFTEIVASFGYSGGNVNSGEFPDGTWWGQPYRIRYGKVGWHWDDGDRSLSAEMKHSRQDIISEIYLAVTDSDPFMKFVYKDVLYQLSLNATQRLRSDDLLVIGADFDHDTIKSDTYLTGAKNVKLQAPYINYTLASDPFDFNVGLRYDHNSEFGQEVSPSLGIVYRSRTHPGTLIRAGVSRAFNAPLLIWKYNANPAFATIPNPDIGAERAWVWEAGAEARITPRLKANLSLYRAEVSDALAQATNALGETYMKNFEKFRRQGGEIQFTYDYNNHLAFSAAAAFNDIENKITKQTVRGGGRPRQSFDVAIEYTNDHGFACSLHGYYDRWNEPATSFPNDRKMLLDIKLSQEIKNITVFLNIHNVTNSKYWADYYFPLPERYFEGGFTLHW